jgi:chromosome segregation ATPase
MGSKSAAAGNGGEMSLEAIERYIHEIEALKDYPRVKGERDGLAQEVLLLKNKVSQFQDQVSALKEKLHDETSRNKKLNEEFRSKQAEVRGLQLELDKTQNELSSLKGLKIKFAEGRELTLEEARSDFIRTREAEIERRANRKFKTLAADYEAKMPGLINQRLVEILEGPAWPAEIAEVVNAKAEERANDVLQNREKWPESFKCYYLDQMKESVGLELDAEFETGVRQEAERQLEAMKASQWREYAAGKARALATSLKDMVKELQGTWRFTCDRCDRRLVLEIGPSEIASLLRGETIDVVCITCSDPAPLPFILSTVPHRVGSLTLERLLQFYMGNTPPHDKTE